MDVRAYIVCPSTKTAYTDLTRAIVAAITTSIDCGKKIRIYECPTCHALHLTRRPQYTVDGLVDAGWVYRG